ncbi:hypothetical protein GF420_14200 [candidate division GN15 bacterium]|nr:hypothetical protein [candidate division GN15 bacterium]
MRQHVQILAILMLVLGALSILGALAVFGVLVGGGLIASSQSQEPGIALLTGTIGTILGVVIAITGIPQLIVGWGLLRHYEWARIVGIIVAILSLFNVPFGTALGIYALWVLFNPETEQLFRQRHATGPTGT